MSRAPSSAHRPARWPDAAAALLRALPSSAPAAIARLAEPWLADRRDVALTQLALAFPERDKAEHDAIWRASVEHHARSLMELARLSGSERDRRALVDRVEIAGIEHADRARTLAREGRGVVVVTAHLGNWELSLAAMAAAGYPMAVVHHGLGRPGLSAWLAGVRTREGDVELVELGAVRAGQVLSRLRAGRHLVAMMDQNARRDEGDFAPFFGAPACTRRGPVVLAMRLGVPLLPALAHRRADGSHRVEFGAPICVDAVEAGDHDAREARVVECLTRVNRVIEDGIRAHPEQWIWSHRRYRTRAEERGAGRSEPVHPSEST